ncbi:hypothetical protein [Lewinella sp. JB7]|uniref:hypothetical protein n=1 Tax=Lewinella sp. JB7 TaxID=2962887 RepID=UPI0020C9FDA0|nr:hypothetical protein [Lewinella sp. JB7]MCP9236876.1 hypothetical protein [Lewinella sp. JB7]
MLRLSSNLTLFLKLFLPVFWTTVMIGATLVIWFAPEHYFGGVPLQSLRWAILFVLLTGLAVFWLLCWPLKRVETDGEAIYVSNYFKTARYDLRQDVAGFSETRWLLLKVCTVELRGAGTFGRRMRFVASRKQYDLFRREYAGAVQFD